jgi:hypothetical protein
MRAVVYHEVILHADLGYRIVDKIRHVQGVVAVRDKLAYPPAEVSFAGLQF